VQGLPRRVHDVPVAGENELPEGRGRGEDEPIRVVEYDAEWASRFEHERLLLLGAIGAWAPEGIHHVGSTSVPGLAAKPVIDILVGIEDLDTATVCFEPLAELQYLYSPYLAEQMHWFCKPDPAHRTHHLHLVPTASPTFRDEITFRDHLRAHRETADRYATLKRSLAVRFEHDREAYTAAKTDFVLRVLREARPA
jgi:GrpB-like predicted nucleotidyltransferase (UPF0157 family)